MSKKNVRCLMRPLDTAICLALLFPALQAAATPSYVITDLTPSLPSGGYSSATAINNSGQVAGVSGTSTDFTSATLWQANGSMTNLGTLPGGSTSNANAINNNGQVVGQSATGGDASLAFSSNGSTMTGLPTTAGTTGSTASGVNNAGQIVGSININSVNLAAIWSNSTSSPVVLTDANNQSVTGSVNGINNNGLLVGTNSSAQAFAANASNPVATLLQSPVSSRNTQALAVNDSGQIAGNAVIGNATNAVLWQNQTSTPLNLGSLGSFSVYAVSSANAINGSGQVVGNSTTSSSFSNAFFWYNSGGAGSMANLNSMVSSNPQSLTLINAAGINAYGQITGNATNSSGDTHAFLATPTGTLNWTAAGSGTWDNPANWQLGFVPNTYLDTVIAPTTGSVTVTGPAVATTVNSLSVGGGGGTAVLDLASTLTVSNAVNLLVGGTLAITGTGSITNSSGVVDNGTFDIAGSTGGTSITTLSGSGSVALGAQTLTLSQASGVFSGAINGTGGLVVARGTETLSGKNTYTGLTAISTGTSLLLTGTGSIATSSSVTSNGTFDISGSTGGASVTTLSGSGGVALGAQTLTLTQASGVFSGAINGTGGLTLAGGAETLTGTNTYSGTTTVSNGTLALGSGGSLANTSNLVVSGGTFNLGGNSQTLAGVQLLSGSIANGNLVSSSNYDLQSGTISANLGGSVSLAKSGTGTVVLNGTNNYSGGTTVSAGTLQGNASSLSGNIVNNAAVVFSQSSSGTYGGSMTGTGTLTKQGSGLLVLTGANAYSGGTTVSAGTLQGNTASLQGNIRNNATVVFDQATAGTYAGSLSGTGALTKQGAGVLVLAGANTYSGGTTVSTGTLQGNTASLQGSITNNAAVVFDQASSGTYSGGLSGTGSLTKQGIGSLTLTSANTFGGNATVAAGTLTNQGILSNQATLTTLSNTSFNNINTLTNTGTISNQGEFSNSGRLINQGSINLTNSNYSGIFNNELTGILDNQNNFVIQNPGSFTNRGNINNSGNLSISNSGSVASWGNFSNSGNLSISNSGSVTSWGNFSNSGTVNISNSGSVASSGNFSNSGTVNISTNAEVYSWGVFNNSGTVTITNPGQSTPQWSVDQNANFSHSAISSLSNWGTLNNQNSLAILSGGFLVNWGNVNNTGTIDNQGTVIHLGGLNNTGSILNSGEFNILYNGQITGNGTLNNQGTFNISGSGSHVINGDVTNLGTFNVHETSVVYTGNFINNGAYVSDPSTNQFNNLAVGPNGYISGGPQDTYIVTGNFNNTSTQNTQWNTANSNLVFASPTSGQAAQHQMQLAGADKGAYASGSVNNFTWGSLTLNNGNSLTLTAGSNGQGSALYAKQINLPGGLGELGNISSNYNVYFDPTVSQNSYLLGGEHFGSGSGMLLPWSFVPFSTATANALGLTSNEKSFAAALNQACTTPSGSLASRCLELQGLSIPQQKQAIVSLTPDQAPGMAAMNVLFSATRMDAPFSRLAALRAGGNEPFSLNINGMQVPIGKSANLFGLNAKGGGAGADDSLFRDSPLGVFIQSRFNFADLDTTPYQRGFSSQTRNVTAGADYRFSDQFVAGVAFNYTNASTKYVQSSGSMNTDTYMGAFYGSYYLPKDFYVDWVANYGGNNYNFNRQFSYYGFTGQTNSNPTGNQYSFAVSGGKEFNWQEWLFNPYLRMEYLDMHIASYQENSGGGFAMTTGGQTNQSLVSDLGTQISHAVSLPWGVVTPALRVEWEHQYLNNSRAIGMRISGASAGLGNFTIQTGSPDRDYVNLGGSLSAALPNGGGLFVRYETRLGQSYISEHIVEAGARLTF